LQTKTKQLVALQTKMDLQTNSKHLAQLQTETVQVFLADHFNLVQTKVNKFRSLQTKVHISQK